MNFPMYPKKILIFWFEKASFRMYIDCVEKLEELCLPPRILHSDDMISEKRLRAVNVWQQFSIRTFGEYSDLYLKMDILLLVNQNLKISASIIV